MTDEQLALEMQQVYAELGFIVITTSVPRRVGHIFDKLTITSDRHTTPQPFMIVGDATIDDWDRQCVIVSRVRGVKESYHRHTYIYRATTD